MPTQINDSMILIACLYIDVLQDTMRSISDFEDKMKMVLPPSGRDEDE